MIVYTIIISYVDFTTNKYYLDKWPRMIMKQKIELLLLLLIHNFIYAFLYFTIFFIISGCIKDRTFIAIYLIVCCTTKLHWKTNKEKCFITEWQNDVMGIKGVGFRDLYNVITNTYSENEANNVRSYFYHTAILTNIIFSAYYLLKKS